MKIAALVAVIALVFLASGCVSQTNETTNSSKIDSYEIKSYETRDDGAVRITNCYPKSCQNPVFSPDSQKILFTRFLNGYNQGPSELVVIDIKTGQEKIIASADSDNVNVPYGSWIGSKIVFSSDISGKEEIYIVNQVDNQVFITWFTHTESKAFWCTKQRMLFGVYSSQLISNILIIKLASYIADDNGENIQQITEHSDADEYYIEPVFNPNNAQKILFEYASDNMHRIAVVELDKNNKITFLTSGYDDRLPSWRADGKKILWQRTGIGKDDWRIFIGDIVLEPLPHLENAAQASSGPDDTDNSWTWDSRYILSSRTGDGLAPNIFLIFLNGNVQRITNLNKADSAPSQSPDKKWIVFESHADKNSSVEIWIIPTPNIIQDRLSGVKTYANTYITYTDEDIEKLKNFDIIMIESYNMKKKWVDELKKSGVMIIAYISVGEADDERRYWKNWAPTERAYDISIIPRTVVDQDNTMFIGNDPGWPGSYFADASDERWQNIILNEELPYIFALGNNQYDGIMMDLIDVVDEYDRLYEEGRISDGDRKRMRNGMIELIKRIREKYPELVIIPNRGFGIIEEIGGYIDGFKFEELTLKYNNIPGEPNYGTYDTQLDAGIHKNQEHIDAAVAFAKKWGKPIFVLDHAETDSEQNNKTIIANARIGYNEAQKLSEKYGVRFIWYANSIDQDLPVWNFEK
ncbi:MAG: endo alpha-1,4 polygalactosaminidase [Candidatus Aenigmarchaeota archaeon]|nr:endo alpha-1,4 polygalactosaminidase [Candidatus Aenigmarchaeota archaeon]